MRLVRSIRGGTLFGALNGGEAPSHSTRRVRTRISERPGRLAVTMSLLCLAATSAGAVPFPSPSMGDYLLIGTGSQSQVGTSMAVSNGEVGANSEAVPMSGLLGSVPALPSNATTVLVGTGGNGDIAITDTGGNFNVSNVDVFGDLGIECSRSINPCTTGNSNSDFNGSSLTNSNGLNGSVNLTSVTDEIDVARNVATGIPAFSGDHQITLTFNDGKWDSDLSIVLASGVTVYDFVTGGNDLVLDSENLLINGPADAFAIFRIPDEANFKVDNSNMVVGNSGIGMNNVLFYTDKPDDNQHVNVNNAIINGIAFWDLGQSGGEIHLDNVQGCSQVVADKVNLNNVRLNNCAAFAAAVPEPSVAILLALGLAGLGATRRSAAR